MSPHPQGLWTLANGPHSRLLPVPDTKGAGWQVISLEQDGDAPSASEALQVNPAAYGPDLGGVGIRVGHDPVRHMGPVALPLLPHPAVQVRILGPVIALGNPNSRWVPPCRLGCVATRSACDASWRPSAPRRCSP